MTVLAVLVVLASSALVLADVCDTCSQPNGSGNNPYCCTCDDCSGRPSICSWACEGGEGTYHWCKWHNGNGYAGCCDYTTVRRHYKTVPGGSGCPCGTNEDNICSEVFTKDVPTATWTSNSHCSSTWSGVADTEYANPPYSCVSGIPGSGGG